MNTYTGSFSGYVVKTTPNVEVIRASSTLPKKITHGVNQTATATNTIGLKEALKTKVTLFGTLLRPKKRKKKHNGTDESTLARPSPVTTISKAKHSSALNLHDGQVVSGRMNELIKHLLPTNDYYPNSSYMFTFILCSRIFMPPSNVLHNLRDLLKTLIEENNEQDKQLVKNFVSLLKDWSEMFPYDFKDKTMMSEFSKCTQLCTKIDPSLSVIVNSITKDLVAKFKDLLQYMEFSTQFHIQCDEEDRQLFDVCRDPIVMAQQLTIIELEKMSRINPEQFVEKFIKESITCSRMDLTSQTSTLELYVSWFNRLSYLVATEICTCCDKKGRSKLINFFIEVGKLCYKRGNFNSSMAIIVGLNMNAVGRMKKTWQKSNLQGFQKLEQAMSPERNFHRYRDTLKERLQNGENDYLVPVFSILVKDVYFLNEGVKDRLPNQLINFEKFWKLTKHIREITNLKDKTCKYKRNQTIIDYLLDTPVCNDEGIYKASFEVEPPDSNFERDRFRSVRIRVGNK